jgi:hypothetical protein
LKKETEQDGKTVYSQTGRVNIVKMATLPRVSYRFNVIPMKIPVSFFTKTEKSILIFMRKYRRPRVTKGILSLKKKKNDIGVSLAPLHRGKARSQVWA